jgi:TolA-binding protein
MEGIQTFELFWVNYPNSLIISDVLIDLGDALVRQGDFKKAVESFQAFLKQFPQESRANAVRERLSHASLKMGKVA